MPTNSPGVRELVRGFFGGFSPCSVVPNTDVYEAVHARRPETAEETIREAIQALAIGSARPSSHRAKEACAVAVDLPELKQVGLKSKVYLAIPPVPIDRIGAAASEATQRFQQEAKQVFGEKVVSFWLMKTQLQCMSLAQKSARQARQRDGNRCALCAHIQNHGGTPAETTARLSVSHLTRRRGVFWRYIGQALSEHPASPQWLFSTEGSS